MLNADGHVGQVDVAHGQVHDFGAAQAGIDEDGKEGFIPLRVVGQLRGGHEFVDFFDGDSGDGGRLTVFTAPFIGRAAGGQIILVPNPTHQGADGAIVGMDAALGSTVGVEVDQVFAQMGQGNLIPSCDSAGCDPICEQAQALDVVPDGLGGAAFGYAGMNKLFN